MALTEQQVMEVIKPIEDPELHLGLVDLGLIYGVDIKCTCRQIANSPKKATFTST